MFKKCFFSFVLLIAAFLFAEPSQQPILKIGGDSDYYPYEYLNARGRADGYCSDLSRLIAERMDNRLLLRLGKWAHMKEWLDEGYLDLIQCMAFSETRAREYYFSAPHTYTWQAIFVRKGSKIHSAEDLAHAHVAVQQGDIAEEYLKEIKFEGKYTAVPTQQIALKLVNNGDYDAAICTHILGVHTIKWDKLKNIKALPGKIFPKNYCYASKDRELIIQVNSILGEMHHTGELARLQEEWFGASFLERRNSRQNVIRVMLFIGLPLLLIIIVLLIIHILLRKKTRLKIKTLMEHTQNLEFGKAEADIWRNALSHGSIIVLRRSLNEHKITRIYGDLNSLGYEVRELLGEHNNYLDLVHPEDRDKYLSEISTLKEGDYRFVRYRVISKDGSILWFYDYSYLQYSEIPNELCLYGYVVDISKSTESELALVKEKEKSEGLLMASSYYLARMSHEIRTPLNGITGFLQLLMQSETQKDKQEIYEIMHRSTHSLMRIINEILDLSKMQHGKMELIIGAVPLGTLISDLIGEFRPQIQAKGLNIECNIDAEVPNLVKGDALRLRQIFINLLQNAIKFTNTGKIRCSVELYSRDEKTVRLLFNVADTGIGIPANRQSEIFDDFTQAGNAKDGGIPPAGTGLGLAIVKRLIELMNGFIWVESEEGKGSQFFFIIPFEEVLESSAYENGVKHEVVRDYQPLNGRILLADNDEVSRMVLEHQLKNWGLKLDYVHDGEEALTKYEAENYDLILMDIYMPKLNGIEVVKRIRQKEAGAAKRTPIFAYTASVMEDNVKRYYEVGMDEVVAKPVLMDVFYKLLAKYLK